MTAFDTNVLIYSCDKADRARQGTAIELGEYPLDKYRDACNHWRAVAGAHKAGRPDRVSMPTAYRPLEGMA
jgi:hypothetical protein